MNQLKFSNEQRPTPEIPEPILRFGMWVAGVVGKLYEARRKIATVAVLAVAALVAYHAVFGENGMVVYEKKKVELKSVNAEVDKLQKENQKLSGEIKALKTDPEAIAKEAREQLRYAKPGEVIFLLPKKPADAPPANATAEKR